MVQSGSFQVSKADTAQSANQPLGRPEKEQFPTRMASAALGTMEAGNVLNPCLFLLKTLNRFLFFSFLSLLVSQAGSSFGELALLYFAPRAATITATADAVVWVTARQQFKELLMKANEKETQENLKHVGSEVYKRHSLLRI